MRVLVVPAAGDGSRFRNEGYTIAKPLIPTDGLPMVVRAVQPFKELVDKIVVIVRKEHLAEASVALPADWTIISQEFKQQGAALSVMSALGNIPEDAEVFVANSDQFFDETLELSSWMTEIEASGCAGSMLTFIAESGPWSYAAVDNAGRVWRVAEKQAISNVATCGVYYFREWRILRDAVAAMIFHQQTYNNEYYLAPAFNQLIDKVVTHKLVDATKFWSVGTPELLRRWEAVRNL